MDAGGAAAREPAGDHGDDGQHEGRRDEGQPVVGGDPEEKALEEAGRAGGRERAEDYPGCDEPRPLPDDEGEDVAALRAEGHADPDLAARCETV